MKPAKKPSAAPDQKPVDPSAFLEIDEAMGAEIERAGKTLERLQRAAELDPEDPDYMDKVDEIAAEIKASRAEDDRRAKAKRLKKMVRSAKSPDARWRAQRLAQMESKKHNRTRRKKP